MTKYRVGDRVYCTFHQSTGVVVDPKTEVDNAKGPLGNIEKLQQHTFDYENSIPVRLDRYSGPLWFRCEGLQVMRVNEIVHPASRLHDDAQTPSMDLLKPKLEVKTVDCSIKQHDDRLTTDPTDPRLTHYNGPEEPAPQAEVYLVLSEEEKAKGFVRPVRTSYIHNACGTRTTMGRSIAETYAANPKFYGATYCCGCHAHFPVAEFVWDGTNEEVGS